MKSKDLQPRLLYPARLSFKIEGEIRSFPDEKKLKDFVNTKPILQQMLKGLLEKEEKERENQDGGIGRHTVPPRTTRTDRKSNGKEVLHQVDKKETYIQTGRRGREDSRGSGGTETGGVWDERGRQSDQLKDPAAPHSCTDKPRGPDSEWWRAGQAERRVAPRDLTLAHR